MQPFEKHIFVCTNQRPVSSPKGCCNDKGGSELRVAFVTGLAKRGLKGPVRANKSGCLDACELGPTVVIYPAGVWYLKVTPDDVEEIIETSIVGDGVVKRLVATPDHWERLGQLRAITNNNIKLKNIVVEGS